MNIGFPDLNPDIQPAADQDAIDHHPPEMLIPCSLARGSRGSTGGIQRGV